MFNTYPTYNIYRTLRLLTPHMKGEDVYALQTALLDNGFKLPLYGADGDFGGETKDAVLAAQKVFAITQDGLAGGDTQKLLASWVAQRASLKYQIVPLALYGQLETESSFRLGSYSPQRSDGTYDAGVTQTNTKIYPAYHGFTVPDAVESLAARVREHYDKFAGISGKRRWALAQGSWNAPAYACYIAKQEGATLVRTAETLKPSETSRLKLEDYMASASAYIR